MPLPCRYYRVEDGEDRVLFQKTLRDLIRRDGDSWLLSKFYRRNRSRWSASERAAIDRIACIAGWGALYHGLAQEMRSYRGERADPERLTINAGSIAGRAARALLVPETLLQSAMRGNYSRDEY